jgi:hypothetical protein
MEMPLVLVVSRQYGLGGSCVEAENEVEANGMLDRPVSREEGTIRLLLSRVRISQRRTSLRSCLSGTGRCFARRPVFWSGLGGGPR